MTTAPAPQPTTERAPARSLTGGQIAVLIAATLPMIAVGIGGAVGTYANAKSVLHRSETALGVVAAGEGATLVAALVMIGVTMLGQAAPLVARAALWLLPASASVMGLAIAPTLREMVVYGLTPLAMTATAEGVSFLARRIVAYTSDIDVEAQRRNAEIMRKIAYHTARSQRHPRGWVRKRSALKAWRLMSRVGDGDAELGSGLIEVQRDRLTKGADSALVAMLDGTPEPALALPVSRALEAGEPASEPVEPTFETAGEPTVSTVILAPHRDPAGEASVREPLLSRPVIKPVDQPVHREPILSPAEPVLAKTTKTTVEPTAETAQQPGPGEPTEAEPGADEKEQQIVALAHRLKAGDRLTKTSAAQILGVSPATAGRRLKEARDRINDGTGFYA